MLQTSKEFQKERLGSGRLAGNFCHQGGHARVFTNRGLHMKLNVGVGGAKRLHQQRKVFARVFASAQKHGDYGDLRGALGGELPGGIGQRWGAQFEVGTKDWPARLLCGDTRSNGLQRHAPEWVTGAVCK